MRWQLLRVACSGNSYVRHEMAILMCSMRWQFLEHEHESEQDDGGAEERGQDMKFRDMQMTLVVFDGTWEHAQEMVKASLPFLSNSVTQLCLPFDVRSLAILEPDGHIVASKLIDVLRKMLALQASHFSSPKVRPKLKKIQKNAHSCHLTEAVSSGFLSSVSEFSIGLCTRTLPSYYSRYDMDCSCIPSAFSCRYLFPYSECLAMHIFSVFGQLGLAQGLPSNRKIFMNF